MCTVTDINKYKKKKIEELDAKLEKEAQETLDRVNYRWRKERMRGMTRDEVKEYIVDILMDGEEN